MKTTSFPEITPAELQRQVSVNPKLFLIDTLPQEHFAQRHLPGASNACVYEVTFLQQVEAITQDKDTPIVVYGSCGTAHEAIVAAEKLARAGYGDLSILEGGLDGWLAAGLPLEGSATTHVNDPGTIFRIADGTYAVDVDKSIIEWTGRNPNGSHTGTVQLSGGKVFIAGERGEGTFSIDMHSIRNIDLAGDELQPVLIAHLNSDDFFFTRVFPTATFTMQGIDRLEEPFVSSPNYIVTGSLELRGVKARLTFPATLVQGEDDTLIAEAHFDVDRTRWNVIYGSARFFQHLGKHLVFDLISLQVRVVAVKL